MVSLRFPKLHKFILIVWAVNLLLTSEVGFASSSERVQSTSSPLPCGTHKVYPGGSSDPTKLILILLLGFNTSASIKNGEISLINDWGGLNSSDKTKGIADLYQGIVYFSYKPYSEEYSKDDTYESIITHHTPILRDLVQSCFDAGYSSIDIVGHSLGGVVALDYISADGLQNPGRVRHVITLDSPVNGGERVYKARFRPTDLNQAELNGLLEVFGLRLLGFNAGYKESLAEIAYRYETRATTQLQNKNFVRLLKDRGTLVATFTNSDEKVILTTDAIIPEASGKSFALGSDDLTLGHFRIFQTAKYSKVLEAIRAELETAPSLPATAKASTSTVLVFDASGSMNEPDASGLTKLQAAQAAAANILNIISAENQAQGATASQVGVVDFNFFARVGASLSTDISTGQTAVQGLYADGGTGMPDGLQAAVDLLSVDTSGSKPIIILLSDGIPNIGHGNNQLLSPEEVKQQVLDLATQAGQKGQCIYTIGFGIPFSVGTISGGSSIDEDFLKQVSANSGCGEYLNAQDALQLANIYVRVRHVSTGNILLEQVGQIAQGQQVDIASVQVPANQSLVLFTLNWPGSRLDPMLKDPSGKLVDTNYPGASISTSPTIASVIVSNPNPGQWQVAAQGADVPEGMTTYNAVLSSRPSPTPITTTTPVSGAPVAFVLLVLAAGGIGVYVYSRNVARARARMNVGTVGVAPAQLIGLSGNIAGRTIPLRGTLTIGRGSRSGLHLAESAVSRNHAIIRYAQGRWFIQDQSSDIGTYVNSQQVTATALSNGDRIRIGGTEFEFRIG